METGKVPAEPGESLPLNYSGSWVHQLCLFFCLSEVECDVARYSKTSWTDCSAVSHAIYYTDIQQFFWDLQPILLDFCRWVLTVFTFSERLLWELQLCRGRSASGAPVAHCRAVQESAANLQWAAVLWLRCCVPQLPKCVTWTGWVFCFFCWSLEGAWLTCSVPLQKLLDGSE